MPSRRKIIRRSAGRGPTISFLFLALGVQSPLAAAHVQPETQVQEEAEAAPDPAQTAREQALAAIERGLAALRAGQPDAEAELTRLLASPDTAEPVLKGLLQADSLPLGLWRAVSLTTTPDFPEPTRLAAVRVLPRFGTRDAATRLLALLDDAAAPVATSARVALSEMTGGSPDWTSDQWREWAAEASGWSDRVWSSRIIAQLAARNRRLAERQRVLGDELVVLYRRLHVELDATGRTTLLAELIRDDRSPLRDLGFELAGRDLSARTQLGPEVAAAAAGRLAHPDAVTRARAATLVSRLVPPDAMLILTRALAGETVPAAAEPMLLGVARWPNNEAVLPTVQWLEREDAPFGAVTTALWALAQADLLIDAGVRERIVATLRARDPARGGEAALKLLVRLGGPDDLTRVAGLLASPEDPLRAAAAGALAETRAGSNLLVEAATNDPRLFAPATKAIVAHDATPDGLRRLAGLPVIDAAIKDQALVDLAGRLRPDQLAAAATGAGLQAAMRETILARLIDPDLEQSPGVGDGLLLLATTRLELRRAGDAVAVLNTIDAAALGESQARTLSHLRLAATVMAGDLEAADELGVRSLEAWMAAWRMLPAESPLRGGVAERIAALFPSELTEVMRSELGLITIGTTPSPEPAAEPASPASEG